LWQILGQPFRGNVFDPLTNARMAVWKYNHQGLGAWAASRGSWGRFVGHLALTQELTTLLGTRASVRDELAGMVPQAPTQQDFIDADIATAALTPGTDDDISAARHNENYKWQILQAAQQSGDPRWIAAAASDYASARDALTALTDATTAQTDAVKAQTDALTSLQDELKRTNDIAQASQDSSGYQATKYLADLLSGKIARGVVGRGFTPSVGVEVAYAPAIF
jgi:multidrug efflux pump subunit AcrA (membrane-fusion protein)